MKIEFMCKQYEEYVKNLTTENVLKFIAIVGNQYRGFKI